MATVTSANYTGTTSGTMNIGRAPATVRATPVSRAYGVANPAMFSSSSSGFIASDSITTSASVTATSTSAPGSYPITVAVSDPNAELGNYMVTNNGGTLTVTQAASSVVLTQTAPATSGTGTGVSTTFTATVTDATANSTGTPMRSVQFLDGSTSPATLLRTGMLTAGVATLTTTSLRQGLIPLPPSI